MMKPEMNCSLIMPRYLLAFSCFRRSSLASLRSPLRGSLRLAVSLRSAVIQISSLLCALTMMAHSQDTSTHDILIEGEEWQEAVTGQTFTDGLASDAEGNLYFTDVKNGKGIYKLGLDGKVSLVLDNQPGI